MFQQCCSMGRAEKKRRAVMLQGWAVLQSRGRRWQSQGICAAVEKLSPGAEMREAEGMEQGRLEGSRAGKRAGRAGSAGCWRCCSAEEPCRARGGRECRQGASWNDAVQSEEEGKLCCRSQSSGRIWGKSRDCLDGERREHNSSGHSLASTKHSRRETALLGRLKNNLFP